MPKNSTNSFINDIPLPASQNFRLLKERGIEFIQEHSGSIWTNLNPSDPGITILDQLCYALTELGYCNDFSIEDLLTGPDGKLKIDDQFFLPEKILTTSPVTINDYRKYLIDEMDLVDNVVIVAVENTAMNIYRVYLLLSENVEEAARTSVCMNAFFILNKSRNLGELFLVPKVLVTRLWWLHGNIELSDPRNEEIFFEKLNQAICNFIFPGISPGSYDEFMSQGFAADDIFNGPALKNGWLPGAFPGQKRNRLEVNDLINIIGAVPGVERCAISGFSKDKDGDLVNAISSSDDEVLRIDLSLLKTKTGISPVLRFFEDAGPGVLSGNAFNRSLKSLHESEAKPGVDTAAGLPVSTFRDVNTYYSIQNTFPEIFAVGSDTVSSNATDIQIAKSRQLKGYLTLFDQVMANQFSQLANIDKLFSFKNAVTAAPSDERSFYAKKNDYEKRFPVYPVPYKSFSPTYFFQSLYHIPQVRPLLKDNDRFMFDTLIESEALREENSWIAYKQNPYNAYIRGLQKILDDGSDNLARRNEILDHLLARHGESPRVINAVIDGSVYSGDRQKDRVIYKSLYLQNLDQLSYSRMRGYNFAGANDPNLIPSGFEDFKNQNPQDPDYDFITNSEQLDQTEKLSPQDFVNYSALELSVCLLFGLRACYSNYIYSGINTAYLQISQEIGQALWLIMNRRGILFIETGLLHYCVNDPKFGGNANADEVVTDNTLLIIIPAFIPSLNTEEFKKRLDIFLQYSLPINLTTNASPQGYSVHYAETKLLEKLIPAFGAWQTDMRYQPVVGDDDYAPGVGLKQSAAFLSGLLAEMKEKR
jgi:hypothetical protein